MKIIIAGAGAVGTHLAKLLAHENQDVILMDEDPTRLEHLTFYNMMTFVGSPTSISSLKECELNKADLFIAVTPSESVNIHACILAAKLGAHKTIARVDTYEIQKKENLDFYKKIGISQLVYPEMLGGEAVAQAIKRPWARMSVPLCQGKLILLMVKVHAPAPIIGQKLMELGQKHSEYHICAIKREGRFIIPGGQDQVQANDIVYFITPSEKVEVVRSTCGKKARNIHRVVIMGGSRLGIQCSYYLEGIEILFIEQNRKKADILMEKTNAKVVHGDAADVSFLRDIGLNGNDAFVALGENSGANVLACLTAKKLGVGKSVAEVEDVEYISLADSLDIGSTVNKKLLTASSIYQVLLDEDKTSAKCFSLIDAEVADLVAQPNSKITRKPVMELGLERGITLGGLVRNNVGMIVNGQTQIQAGDHVVVVCMNEKIGHVEKLFT